MNLFISHSSKDAKTAGEICEMLEKAGYKCFLAPRDIRSGHEYAEEIINGIDNSAAMILLLSKAADSSPHVLREIERAVSKKLPIIVYKLEEITLSKSMEYFLMTHQWVSEKPKAGYQELLKSVNDFFANNYIITQNVTENKKASKSLIIKAVSISAAAAVLVTAAVLIFGAVHKPDSALNEGVDITEGTTPESINTEAANETIASETADGSDDAVMGITTIDNTAETETEEQSAEADLPVDEAELGDTVILGEYMGEAIKWRIIALEDEGRTALVISDNVLAMKCFDAAEGGKYNSLDGTDYWRTAPENMDRETERLVRGDNTWKTSNLRTWLNSDRDNVIYGGQAPDTQSMSEKKNGYNTEGGFLKSFTKEEIKAVLTSSVVTNGTATEDKIFMLSRDELSLLDEADVSIYAVPTESAVKQDQSRWYELNVNDYKIRDHYWWLRDPDLNTGSQVYLVNFSYGGDKIISQSAGLEGYGVRPAMRIDLTAECVKIK